MINAGIVEAFLKCPTKCYLRSLGEVGPENGYANWVRAQNESYRTEGIKRLIEGTAPDECIVGLPTATILKAVNWRLAATDNLVRARNLESCLPVVERIAPEGRGKAAQFVSIRFVFTNKLGLDDKRLLAFDALVLSESLGRTVDRGKITGDRKVTSVKTSVLANVMKKITGKIASLLSGESPPDLILNRHCARMANFEPGAGRP